MEFMEGNGPFSSPTTDTRLFGTPLVSARYIDDIFMATNQTMEEISVELEKAKAEDVNINISVSIDTSVYFLDITIANELGKLRTSIYHKPTTEPYILPYTSDHPRHIHRPSSANNSIDFST